jgi:pimeloyl-ACP methyl ester carboxylesterase
MKPDPRFHGRFVEGGAGTKLFVEAIGNPAHPPVLFIHGFSQCRLAWDRQFEVPLAADFYLVRLDIRGHGLSDKPRDAAAYQNGKHWADDIHAVIRALGLKRPVLSGWSYGGYIMCDYVRHYGQEAIGGLNFVAAATELGSDEASMMLGPALLALAPGLLSNNAAESSLALASLVDLLTHGELDPHDFYFFLGFNAAAPPHVRQAMFGRKLDNRDVLRGLKVPVLITHGQEDQLVLTASADFIASHIPHASRVDYPRCGHAPFFEVADQFNRDLAAFARKRLAD